MSGDGTPIAYSGDIMGVPMLTHDGHTFGTVEHVLEVPEEDLFDGIVVRTSRGLRFVDRDQITQITTTEVRCSISDAQADSLPTPDGNPVYDVDSREDSGKTMHDFFGQLFRRPRWPQEQEKD